MISIVIKLYFITCINANVDGYKTQPILCTRGSNIELPFGNQRGIKYGGIFLPSLEIVR